MAQFEIRDLTFTYPSGKKKALDSVSLNIEKGEYITICGRSGSGKTTLLRHMKNVLAPHGKLEGEILFEGSPVSGMSLRDQAQKIGYVMQDPDSQIVTDKVWHELAFGLESLGTDQKTMILRVAEMASFFGIQDWFHKDVSQLSGGQKQLLNLASIMAMQPEVLILDEPTSQLDPIAAADFLNTVRKINLELGTTIIITEHRLEDILHASDRVIILDEGRKTADDAPKLIGEALAASGSEMFTAMPSPVKIYYSLKGTDGNDAADCPLTVREGRNWLSGLLEKAEIKEKSLPSEEDKEITDPAILFKEVWFRYEKDSPDVLKGMNLAVDKGSIHAVVGGNGTGKSTALKAVCDICRPYRGHIFISGKRADKYKKGELFDHNIAMLPQDPRNIFVKKTVREDLAEMLPGGGADAGITAAAALCGIENILNQHPYDISGGEQQRAALAKVLLTEPEILLLDEPTKGMDNFFKISFAQILRNLVREGKTILMVSHDIEFCARYADRISMFFDGGVMTTDTPRRFFSRNSFYTTAANRMSRHIFDNAVTDEDVVTLCKDNMKR